MPFAGDQACPAAADFIGEHPDGRLRQVYGGDARGRLAIHRAAPRDEIRDQRDVDTDPQLALRRHFAAERVVDLERLLVVDSERDRSVDRCTFHRCDRGRFDLGRFAELGRKGADRGEPRGSGCCPETVENFEGHLGRVDVGRRLPQHHGQFLAPGGGILEITLQLRNQRPGFLG